MHFWQLIVLHSPNIISTIILRALAAMTTGYPLYFSISYCHACLVLWPGCQEVSVLYAIVKAALHEASFVVLDRCDKELVLR